MKNRFRKALVSSALGAGLLVASAVPAHSAPAEHCPHPPITVESVYSCACDISMTILRDLTGDPWTCMAPPG